MALRGFREGDRVKVLILGIENKRISLGLKPSYFSKEDLEDEGMEVDEEEETDGGAKEDTFEAIDQSEEEDLEMDPYDEQSDEEMDIDVGKDQVEYQQLIAPSVTKASSTRGPTLSSIGGFQWPSNPLQEDEDEDEGSSSDDDEDIGQPSKKRRKRKEIEQDLTADMHTKTPESNADFERLLLGSPNSSYLWIQYMSFQLPLSEIDKAREIARRAVKTISFREEKERMNVWIALLNLENVYGNDETLDETFKEAARANDSKTIHLRLALIFEQSDKVEVRIVFRTHCKASC